MSLFSFVVRFVSKRTSLNSLEQLDPMSFASIFEDATRMSSRRELNEDLNERNVDQIKVQGVEMLRGEGPPVVGTYLKSRQTLYSSPSMSRA